MLKSNDSEVFGGDDPVDEYVIVFNMVNIIPFSVLRYHSSGLWMYLENVFLTTDRVYSCDY